MRDILLAFYVKYCGSFSDMYNALKNKEYIDPDDWICLLPHNQDDYWTIIDDDYPSTFKDRANPPIVIYKEDADFLVTIN